MKRHAKQLWHGAAKKEHLEIMACIQIVYFVILFTKDK